MDELHSTVGIIAAVAAAVAVVAMITSLVQARMLRRLRADQLQVLGSTGSEDLVAHAARLEREFGALHAFITDAAARLDERVDHVEARLDGAVTRVALLRYDAYNEMSGRQSTSIALLDERGCGVVLSAIHHRDQARLYAKQIQRGRGELRLSPEEEQVIALAQAGSGAQPGIDGAEITRAGTSEGSPAR